MTRTGEQKEAWIVDYRDGSGKRHIETKARKKDADAREAQAAVDIAKAVHIAPSQSITVEAAGKLWIAECEGGGLERSTVDAYKQHLRDHINPRLGATKLSHLSVGGVREFRDWLRANGRKPPMVKRVIGSLGSLLADAVERQKVATNVVRSMRRGKQRHADKRQKCKLKVGVDIPTPNEIKKIIAHLPPRWRPVLLTAIFTGLRASELRGLGWKDVRDAKIHVEQRADRYKVIGPPKSESGHREVPLPPIVANTLREWELRCPKGEHGLVFPNGSGNIEDHANIITRGFVPAQECAHRTIATSGSD